MSLAALATELVAGHPVTGAYDADDALAAVEVNAVNVDRMRPITAVELFDWSLVGNRSQNLSLVAASGASDRLKSLALNMSRVLDSSLVGLDPSKSSHVDAVNELVTAGVWSAADRTALVAAATDTVSQAVALNLGRVREGEVQQARAL